MKYIIMLSLLLCSTIKAEDYNSTDYVVGRSRTLHFVTAYGLGLTTNLLFKKMGMKPWERVLFSMFIVNMVGAVKEMTDPHPDTDDIKWNFLGSAAANTGALVFEF